MQEYSLTITGQSAGVLRTGHLPCRKHAAELDRMPPQVPTGEIPRALRNLCGSNAPDPFKGQPVTLASVPARICLAGESLDWMTGGPSITAAVDVRLYAAAWMGCHADFHIRSESPFNTELALPESAVGFYSDNPLNYVNASLSVLRKKGVLSGPMQIRLGSEIPAGAGVSSSAATSIGSTAAASRLMKIRFSLGQICRLAFKVEHEELRTGAGQMDFYACGTGGLHYMNCSKEPPKPLHRLQFPDVGIILVDTLSPHPPRSHISSKRVRFAAGDRPVMDYAEEMPAIVEHMMELLNQPDPSIEEVGHLITRSHQLLRDNMECSTDLLDACVDTCMRSGAFGAKLTGSGMGGCMFALARKEDVEKIEHELSALPVKVYPTRCSAEGLRLSTDLRLSSFFN